jgi:AraC-like DNA-binding protein
MAKTRFKQFFLENPLKNSNIMLNGVGFREKMAPSMIQRPKGKEDFLFMFFYDSAFIGSAKTPPLFDGGIFIIWQPGTPQYYGNPDKEYTHTWTHCQGLWIERLVSKKRFPLDKPLRIKDPSLIEEHVSSIYNEASQVHPDPVIVCNLYDNWLRIINRTISEPRQAPPVPDWLIQIRNFMEREYRKKLTLAQLASYGYKSVPHFCSEFKKHFKCPPIEFIIRLRLNEALHLLHDINLSVTEIAELVGYDDLYHFSKIFKSCYGVSPLAMRKRFKM